MPSEPPTSDSPIPPGVNTDSTLLENCPVCETPIDVTELEPLSKAACSACGKEFVVGEWIDQYQLLSVAGRGGMGVVYRAQDTSLDRMVALKVLRKDRLSSEAVAELETEAAITASINHPHVVKVFTTGTDHGRFFLAMELVEKGTLDDLIRIQGQVAEAQVLEVAIQVAQGLRAALQIGMIHRDVKPGNILFADSHTAKVVDFGLAMAEKAAAEAAGAEIWGTPYYVAPEKLDQQPEDFRSDMYSLGASLFHALAGRPPFEAEDASMVALKHLKSQAVSLQAFAPRVSGATAFVINRTLLKNPDERYQSYDELIEHLEYARNELQAKGNKPTEKKRLVLETEEDQKIWSYLTFGMIAVCLLLGGGAYFYWKRDSPTPKPAAAAAAVESTPVDPRHAAQYQAARQQLLVANFDSSAPSFHALAEDKETPAPMREWAILHAGLSELFANHPTEAGVSFTALRNDDYSAPDFNGRKLGEFFRNVAELAGDSQTVPASATKDFGKNDFGPLASLVLGLKDWDLGQYDEAGSLLRAYASASPEGEFAWVGEYKSLTGNYVADYADYRGAVTMVKIAKTPDEVSKAKAALEKLKGELRTGAALAGPIDELLASLEKAPGKPASRTASRPAAAPASAPDAGGAAAAAPKEIVETAALIAGQLKALNAARAKAAESCAQWRFSEARSALDQPKATGDAARLEKWNLVRKLDWLVDFKRTLIGDAKAHGSKLRLKKVDGTELGGPAKTYTEDGVTLASGEVVPWPQISPESALELAKEYFSVDKNPEQMARRAWLAGNFALCFRELTEARNLLAEGAKGRADYADAVPILLPGRPVDLARGADVTASNPGKEDHGETPDRVIDGSTGTKWYTDEGGPQWLCFDLHKDTLINRWVVKHAQSGGEPPEYNSADFGLQKSADGKTWTTVDAVTGNAAAVTTREVTPFTTRYVRMAVVKPTQSGKPGTRICEVELYGPSAAEPPQFTDALQATVVQQFKAVNLGLPADAASGKSVFDPGTGFYGIESGGKDIWETEDTGRFLGREAVGNGKIQGYIRTLENSAPYAKCGVMYRTSEAANSAMAYLCITPTNGLIFIVRKTDGGNATSTKLEGVTLPCWLRVSRHNDDFAASYSTDGAVWKQVGNVENVPLGKKPLIGLAATSHAGPKLALSKVSDVKITGE